MSSFVKNDRIAEEVNIIDVLPRLTNAVTKYIHAKAAEAKVGQAFLCLLPHELATLTGGAQLGMAGEEWPRLSWRFCDANGWVGWLCHGVFGGQRANRKHHNGL